MTTPHGNGLELLVESSKCDIVMFGMNSVTNAAFDLDPQDHSMQEIRAVYRLVLRYGEDRRQHRTRRMNRHLQMRVV